MNLHEWIARKVDETEAEGRAMLIDPTPILRRCEADRRILDRHRIEPTYSTIYGTACNGCGTTGYADDPVISNLNDCPELLDLAHAHGITDAILASLDRPQSPPEPVLSFTEALANAFGRLRDTTPASEAPATFRPAPTQPTGIPITQALAHQRFNPWH